jgi:hypothetical protein
MPTVPKSARTPADEDAVWRICPACDQLAAMAPEALFCDACAAQPTTDERGVSSR